jgi:hypothetical protein
VGEHRPPGGRCAAGGDFPKRRDRLDLRLHGGAGEKEIESRHLLCWPEALRKVRTWLEPYVMLMRYWKAYSEKPPPKELRRLLERVFVGKGLYLYAH